jgi:hypothetical protein
LKKTISAISLHRNQQGAMVMEAISKELDRKRCVCEKIAGPYVGASPRTMQAWRVQGKGPVYLKLGRAVRYRICDLDDWLEANRRKSTSQGEV